MTRELVLSTVITLLLLGPIRCQIMLGDPCAEAAYYDGTDISRPYLVDNSTGIPVYTYLDDNYHPASNHAKRAATSLPDRLWPKGIVPYSFAADFKNSDKEVVFEAMRQWEEKTCIRFHPRPSGKGGIMFMSGLGCRSYVGRLHLNYLQPISPCPFLEAALHEIGHVIGFWHEQNRRDRDKYININRQNIQPGKEFRFEIKNDTNSLGVTYDFNSIMHYTERAFAKTGKITITAKEKDLELGNGVGLSPLDIKQTNLLYKTQCALRSSSESISTLPLPGTFTTSPVMLPSGRCNKHIIGATSQIFPPDNPYNSNTDCAWVIEVPKGYVKMHITFYDIDIGGSCRTDDSTHIGYNDGYFKNKFFYQRICGNGNYTHTTSGKRVYITFHTDEQPNNFKKKGFSRIEYIAQDFDECTYRYFCNHYCVNLVGSYTCTCRSGYYLAGNRLCVDHNECGDNNGGCSHECVNMLATHRCECPTGYSLLSNKRDCIKGELPCKLKNGGCQHICNDTMDGAICSCYNGYQLVNEKSCEDVDECIANSGICGANKNCINNEGSYICQCQTGFKQLSNKTCHDINECSIKEIGMMCGVNKHCVNTPGSYNCSCNNGFKETRNGHCVDINECRGGNGKTLCPADKDCINIPGTYYCRCKKGYKRLQNGTCEDINECERDICEHRCINHIGNYRCECYIGYQLMDDHRSCEDINECAVDNGGCDETCINTNGSYLCQCHSGLQLLSDNKSCGLSSQECVAGSHGCKAVCNDKNSSCCLPGHRLNRNGMLCRDEDECGEGLDKCEQKCFNTNGSYYCDCYTGYRLRIDQRKCKEIDECSNGKHSCSHMCINTPGSYYCECPKGFELATDSVTCRDINECERSACSHDCVNTIGSFQCLCPSGYRNKSLNLNETMFICEDINECEEGDHECTHNCINTMGSYNCSCRSGFYLTGRKKHKCRDINECSTNNGGCDHTCKNTRGSFKCSCNTSYILIADEKSCVTSCDNSGIIHEPTGHISTTGFPNSSYAYNSNCTWIIELPEQYQSIELKVDGLSIEESPNCTKDQLTILNGKHKNSISFGNYCGSGLPATIRSSTGVVAVKFFSDDAINKDGFSLHYKGLTERVKGVYGCNSTIRENTAFALSIFPSEYTSPIDCVYSLIAPMIGYKVKVTFLYLDIQEANCSLDRVEVYDGKRLARYNKVTEICNGDTHRSEFTSSGRHMRIRYIGNTLNAYQGFHASVKFHLSLY